MIDWKTMSSTKASDVTKDWSRMLSSEFKDMVNSWSETIDEQLASISKSDDDYISLRHRLMDSYDYVMRTIAMTKSAKGKEDYYFDMLFGIEIYNIFNELGMNVRYASMTDIWIFLNINVIPDIIYKRFCKKMVFTKDPETGEMIRKIPEDRYWKVNRRVYLKQLWWFIHLSAQYTNGQFNPEETIKVLRHGTTDTVAQLVERSGKFGYRVNVSRKLMHKVAWWVESSGKVDDPMEFFRGVMVLMTARTPVIEPAFANINSENAISIFLDEVIETNKRGRR